MPPAHPTIYGYTVVHHHPLIRPLITDESLTVFRPYGYSATTQGWLDRGVQHFSRKVPSRREEWTSRSELQQLAQTFPIHELRAAPSAALDPGSQWFCVAYVHRTCSMFHRFFDVDSVVLLRWDYLGGANLVSPILEIQCKGRWCVINPVEGMNNRHY